MKRILLSLGIMVLAVTVFAQTSSAAPMQGYAGPARPASETAVLRSGAYTEIVSIDGTKVNRLTVAVLPGEHTAVMKPVYPFDDNMGFMGAYFFYSDVNGSVTFNAEAGHEYVVNVSTAPGPTSEDNMGTGFIWVGYIVDKASHERVAKTEKLALEAYPVNFNAGGGIRK